MSDSPANSDAPLAAPAQALPSPSQEDVELFVIAPKLSLLELRHTWHQHRLAHHLAEGDLAAARQRVQDLQEQLRQATAAVDARAADSQRAHDQFMATVRARYHAERDQTRAIYRSFEHEPAIRDELLRLFQAYTPPADLLSPHRD